MNDEDSLNFWQRTLFNMLAHKKGMKTLDKIKSKDLIFLNYSSPVSIILNIKNKHIIAVDVDLMKKIFDKKTDEICAILLHELGHIFNKPKDGDVVEGFRSIHEEYYADDFARKMGFEKELLSSLKTLRSWKRKRKQNVNLLTPRINRINKGDFNKEGVEID